MFGMHRRRRGVAAALTLALAMALGTGSALAETIPEELMTSQEVTLEPTVEEDENVIEITPNTLEDSGEETIELGTPSKEVAVTVNSDTLGKTRAEAMDWVRSKVGQWLKQPNGYGGQCVDLVGCYLNYLGTDIIWGNANQYTYAGLPYGVTRIQGAQPQEGDILVYTGGQYGHVAIYESDYVTYHQNYQGQYVTRQTMYYANAVSGYWGVIRPSFKPSEPARTIPGRILDRPNVSVEPGDFVIRSAIGNKVLTIGGGVHGQNGANAQLWTGNAFDNSVFRIEWNGDGHRIKLKSSGKVLDTYGNPWSATVANVQQWDDLNEPEQRWIFQDAGGGWVYIRNLNGYYLDVEGGWSSNRDGGNVQTWDPNESEAQKWKLERQIPGDILPNANVDVTTGEYVIRSAIGGRVLDINCGSDGANGANAQLWERGDNTNQAFHIEWDGGTGGYRIALKSSGKILDTAGEPYDATLSNVQQWDDKDESDQRWLFQDAGDDWVYIRNLNGFYLDVEGGWGSNRNGGNVQTWVANSGDAQKWKLERTRRTISGAELIVGKHFAYTGAQVTPSPTVKVGDTTLVKGTDYTVSYKNNVSAGTATVTITGKGNYFGTKSATFQITKPSVSYRTHMQRLGWQGWRANGKTSGKSGKSLRMEALQIKLKNTEVPGGIRYRSHVQKIGWQGWKANGKMSGTSDKSLRIEAIKVQLTGQIAELYDVWYRVYAQKIGWMGWAKNGSATGTQGYSYRLESMQVVLLPKGSAAPGATAKAFLKKDPYASAIKSLKKASTESAALFKRADVYGDTNKELLSITFTPGGNGRTKTLYVYTLSKGKAKRMLKHTVLCGGDFDYAFYKSTGGFVLHEGSTGHHGQQYTYFSASSGTYKKVAHSFLAIGSSKWKHSSGYSKAAKTVTKGTPVVIESSYTW